MKPNHTRAVRLFGTAVIGAGLALAPLTAAPAQAADEVTINLLNFNDFHGRIAADTTVQFAGTIEKERATYGVDNTLLLSAGDNIGASLFASATQADQPTIDVLNALNVRASAVGNHEFDKGFADLTGRVIGATPNAKWDYLGANVYKVGTQIPALPEYKVYTVGGITVGVIGVVTQETPSLVSSIGIKDITFGDPVEAMNRVAAQLSDGNAANGEAQVLVAEYHEGAARSLPVPLPDQVAAGGAFADIVNKTAASVDVIFTGHTHQSYSYTAAKPGGGDRPVLQAASYSEKLAQAVLTVDASGNVTKYAAKLIDRTKDKPADLVASYSVVQTVDDITKAALAYAEKVGSEEVGKLTADITTAFSGGDYVNGVYTGGSRDDRAKESTMGTLIADSLLKTLSNAERGGAQIGIVNPGGMRAELLYKGSSATTGDADGKIVRSEANSVLPFVNNLWTTTLTGAQLRSVLEEQWQPAGSSRPYLQLGLSSNVSYTYNSGAAAGSRIGRIMVNGKLVNATDTFRIGSFSFLLAGGDNFNTFKAGTRTLDSGLVDYEAWIDYLKANSPVKPSFAKHGVGVTSSISAKVGQSYTLSVSSLDLTSLGSPANTTLKVTVDGEVVADNVPVTKGAAQTTFIVKHNGPVVLTANPSGTVVHGSVVISKVDAKEHKPSAKATVKKGKSYTFKTKLAEIGNGVWPTGKLYTYVNGKKVDTQSLRTVEKGVQKITLTKKDLKRFGKKTVTVTTKITSSRTVNTAVVKTIKLKIK